ncbi:MAG: nuclear transport factor 2 family protein [Blastocatellia bacterium]|nr:nuclear transport factor 2 family protein [Blastocatellia bacterium]
MKALLAGMVFLAALSLCNLSEKLKSGNDSNTQRETANTNTAGDREALTVELMKIEGEITSASFKGDISTLASYIADDYSGTGADGKTQNKNQVLAATKPDKNTKSWKITDGQLSSFSDDSAVLTYVQSQTLRNGRTYSARVTDTFVKRDGRWLVKSEQQTLMK